MTPAPPSAPAPGGWPPVHLWTPPAIAGAGGHAQVDSGTRSGAVDSPVPRRPGSRSARGPGRGPSLKNLCGNGGDAGRVERTRPPRTRTEWKVELDAVDTVRR